MRATCNISISLGPDAWALAKTAGGGINVAELIRSTTQDWLDALSLPVDADVKLTQVQQAPGPRFIDIAVILNGVRCGFSKRQLVSAYEGSTHRQVADHAAGVGAARDLLAEAAADKGESLSQAQALLAELAVEAVKSSPERVITPQVTEALLTRVRKESAAARPAVKAMDRNSATEVLRRLTAVHVGVEDAAAFVQLTDEGLAEGLTASEMAERFIDLWRPRALEIHVDPSLARRLLKNDPVTGRLYPSAELEAEPADVVGLMCDGLFYELGVWFPRINIVVDAELPSDCCRFRLHHRMTPVLRGLAENELLVNETPASVTGMGITDGRPRANPVNGSPYTVISRSSRDQVPPGSTTWDQLGYIVLLLSSELRNAASNLLSLEDVEDLLGKLNTAFPALVAATLHRFSPLEVAQVLRWLLSDDVSIRDLRSVLELMLDFSYTTGVRSPTAGWAGREPYVYIGADELQEPFFTVDDPYILRFDLEGMQLFAEPAPEWIANGRMYAEFVKCGFRQYVTHKVTRGQNTLICYLVDSDIEKRLMALRVAAEADPPFSEPELTDILKGLGDGFVESYGTPVLFLATTPDVALLLRDLIKEDFPEVTVLHRQLVDGSANVQSVATVPGRKRAIPAS